VRSEGGKEGRKRQYMGFSSPIRDRWPGGGLGAAPTRYPHNLFPMGIGQVGTHYVFVRPREGEVRRAERGVGRRRSDLSCGEAGRELAGEGSGGNRDWLGGGS